MFFLSSGCWCWRKIRHSHARMAETSSPTERLWRQRHGATWPEPAWLIGVQQGSEQSLGSSALVAGTWTNSRYKRPTFPCSWNYCSSFDMKSQHPSELNCRVSKYKCGSSVQEAPVPQGFPQLKLCYQKADVGSNSFINECNETLIVRTSLICFQQASWSKDMYTCFWKN